MENIIVGKRSILSFNLKKRLPAAKIITTKDFLNLELKSNSNLIINLFYPSNKLNSISKYSDFIHQSLYNLSIGLDKINKKKINKIIYTSSASVYGLQNFDENSIIIDAFTQNHGKYTGIVYGGSSRKVKRNFQIGNKILINWKSKSENKMGYFTVELIEPIAPYFFDDKKRSICILAASSLLKILLPDRQINKKIYESFDKLISDLKENNWIKLDFLLIGIEK